MQIREKEWTGHRIAFSAVIFVSGSLSATTMWSGQSHQTLMLGSYIVIGVIVL